MELEFVYVPKPLRGICVVCNGGRRKCGAEGYVDLLIKRRPVVQIGNQCAEGIAQACAPAEPKRKYTRKPKETPNG